MVFEQAGALTLCEIGDRSGNPLALPVSSTAGLVDRDIAADEQQLQAFLTGCGVPLERDTPWLTSFRKISSRLTELPGADSTVEAPAPDIRRWTRQSMVDAERVLLLKPHRTGRPRPRTAATGAACRARSAPGSRTIWCTTTARTWRST
ncbi:hypothetical protein ABZ446_45520 [Streptomyces sp. NPDC005813]|uniref:hypothetical protein n=1 Tax=Streptomyces sp. NPDC005813 TaxID=3155592 RepID=UPI00340D52B9